MKPNKHIGTFATYFKATRDYVTLYYNENQREEAIAYNEGMPDRVQGFAVFDRRLGLFAALALFPTMAEAEAYELPLDKPDELAAEIPEVPGVDPEPPQPEPPQPEPKGMFRSRRQRDQTDE